MEHNNMLRFGCIRTYCVASLGKEEVRAFDLRRGGKLLLSRCMLVVWSQRLMKLSPGVVKALHGTYKKYRKVGVLGFVFKVNCWLKPITVEAFTRYCDALPKSKLRKWGFWGGVVGFCWRTICAKRCSFLGSPILHQQIRGPKTLIEQWLCCWHQCLYTLSTITVQHLVWTCLLHNNARLWAPVVEEVVVDVWQAAMAGDVIPKKTGWLSKDQVMLCALQLINLPYEGIWTFGSTGWLDWLAGNFPHQGMTQ